MNDRNTLFRKAKTTPTKKGQFITIWKRNQARVTVPYHISDNIDFFIVLTIKTDLLWIFIFPKAILHQNNILADNIKNGKRGIRVYPPWDIVESKQAKKTQIWRNEYFIDLNLKSVQSTLQMNKLTSILNRN